MISLPDIHFMRLALRQARLACKAGEVPVGAVAVLNGKVVARGYNRSIGHCDPTAHAEIVCLRKSAQKLQNYRLSGTILYVTKEPCVMCAGALVWARVGRVVFGCWDTEQGACGSYVNFADSRPLNHKFQVVGGVLEDECRAVIQQFFKDKRRKQKGA